MPVSAFFSVKAPAQFDGDSSDSMGVTALCAAMGGLVKAYRTSRQHAHYPSVTTQG